MKRFSFILGIGLVLLLAAGAKSGAQETNAPAGADAASAHLRDPFWPVGYLSPGMLAARNPEMPQAPLSRQDAWNEAAAKISVQGITRMQANVVAMINGQMVGVNDRISVEFEGSSYRWQILAISTNGVQLQRVDVSAQEVR